MEVPVDTQPQARGTELLLRHCLAFGGDDGPRQPARDRLEVKVGADFARLLVVALTPQDQGRRGSSSP